MFVQAAVALGLAVTAVSGQQHRGQRHERQAPPYYGSTNSTSSTWSISSSTSSPSLSSTSSASSSSTSASPYTSADSTSSGLAPSSTSPSGSRPTAYSLSASTSSAQYQYYPSGSSGSESYSTPLSSSTANLTSSSASPHAPSSSLTLSTTISTYVTVSTAASASLYSATHFSYSPSAYNASSSGPSATGGTGPSSYGLSPVGPETSSPVTASYGSTGTSLAASENSTAVSPSYYGPSPVGPETNSATPVSTSYDMPNSTFSYSPGPTITSYAGSGIPWSPNATFSYQHPGSGRPQVGWNPYNTSSSTLQPQCHGATLNVLNASLDWWYTSTFTYVASTFSAHTTDNLTGWTLIPASTTFNVTTALASPSCSWVVTETAGWDHTYSFLDGTCYRTPKPVAASTTVVSVSAFAPLNQTTGNGTIPLSVVTAPPVASVTIPAINPAANTTSAGAYAAGTPFVYFSRYEIVKKHNTTNAWGNVACAEVTATHNMSEPFSFEYEGPHVNGLLRVGANVTGDVNPALLGVVGQETAIAGSWVAAPTVVVVLKKVLAAQPNAVPFAQSASELQTITPTLPPGFSGLAPDGLSSIGVTVRVESTQPVLLLPTTTKPTPAQSSPGGNGGSPAQTSAAAGGAGQTSAGGGGGNNGGNNGGGQVGSITAIFTAVQGGSSLTLGIAVPSTQTVVTAVAENGQTVTATRATAGSGSGQQNGGGGGGVGGNLASIVVSAQQPTNALQVLTQAESEAGNPTAGAIVAGLGGSSNQGGGGGSPVGDGGSGSGGSGSGGSGNSGSGTTGPGNTGSGDGDAGAGGSGRGNGGSGADGNSGSGNGNSGSGSGSGTGSGSPGSPDQNSGSGTGSGDSSSPGSGGPGGSSGQGIAPLPVITVGHSTITAQPTPALVISGQTVVPGGQPITVGSETIALPAGGNAIVVDGSTLPFAGSIASSTVFNVGGVQITALPAPAFVVGSQTLSAGGSAVIQDGTTLSLLPQGSAIVVNGVTSQLGSQQTPGAAANIPLLTIGSQTFTANAATQFSLGPDATLTQGGQVVMRGTTISLEQGAGAVIVNGQKQSLSPPAITPAPLLTLDNTVYQANAGSTYDVLGHLLQPGGVITVSGSTISLLAGASVVVVDGSSTTLIGASSHATPNSNLATITAPAVLTVDNQAYAANGASEYIISDQTLKPGMAITLTESDGSVETISLNSAANELFSTVSGTVYSSLAGMMGAMPTGPPILTINGRAYSAVSYDTGSGPTYEVQGQQLTRGGEVILDSPSGGKETISLDAAGTVLETIYQGHTTFSTISGAHGVLPTAAPFLTIGGQVFTAINAGATYVIDGKTLTPNDVETVVIDGNTYILSLSSQATLLEIEAVGANGEVTATSYETLFPAQMTQGTITNTVGMPTAGASLTASGASATGGAGGSNANLQNSSSSLSLQLSAAVVAFGTLVLAICL